MTPREQVIDEIKKLDISIAGLSDAFDNIKTQLVLQKGAKQGLERLLSKMPEQKNEVDE